MTLSGFSLIEVFFAILILAGVFLALATIIPVGLASVRKGQTTVVATNLARQTLETWREVPWTGLQALEGSPSITTFPSGTPPTGWDPASIYTVIVNVSGSSVTGDANVIEIDVTVMWNAGGLSGNQQTQTPEGVVVPGGYSNSSVTLHTQVVNPLTT